MFKYVMDRELGINYSKRDLEKYISYKFLGNENNQDFVLYDYIIKVEFPQEQTILYARTKPKDKPVSLKHYVDDLEKYAVLLQEPNHEIEPWNEDGDVSINTLHFTAKNGVSSDMVWDWMYRDPHWDDVYVEEME
jgi:hypothetical protein